MSTSLNPPKYKAAVVQAEPGWFDLELSTQKTIDLINDAGSKGCKLIAFPELWIPGYPFWMWKYSYPDTLHLLKSYRQNSLPSDAPQMQRIRAAARKNSIYVSLGYSEIDFASCYIAQVLISPAGKILNHRRKIKATHVERLIFGDGTGESLDSVVQTDIGRVGHLNCWENLNPLLKAHSAALGEQVHVAAWPLYPPASTLKHPDPYTNVADSNADIITPAYAIETGTFVLAPFQTLSNEGNKKNTPAHLWQEGKEAPACGFSRAFRPDGHRLCPDPDPSFEGLLVVDIDLDESHLAKALLDVGGHYMRPELIRLLVNKKPISYAVHEGSTTQKGHETQSTLKRVGLDKPLPEDVHGEG
ncbi:carbon-nitrogen hydrolase [Diplogelasinospora grovesii]|uniref:Carbon-nitrogen hydrolase n=1 Tax=Diplogelasinospora grovesii TaxID=303347 RepID=A0AAN6MV00_9PEZI|nr:carbon-nitrogen hydrolase [Diplogelasinospora grovesii]